MGLPPETPNVRCGRQILGKKAELYKGPNIRRQQRIE
jgi:hypothetical protein